MKINKINNLIGLAFALVFTFVLAGCGGGSSGSGGVSTNPIQDELNPIQDELSAPGAITAILAAAAAAPTAGSVTQSSSDNNTTEVTVTSANGQLVYRAERLIRNDDDALDLDSFAVSDGSGEEALMSDEDLSMVLSRTDSSSGSEDPSNILLSKKTNSGTWLIDIYTDSEATSTEATDDADSVETADADYLAAGIWVWVPDDPTSLFAVGAFADGNDPFTQANLAAVTGTANYEGPATGVFVEAGEDGSVILFEAAAELTAAFGAADLGSIEGMITDFVDEDGESISEATLTLGETDIGGANSGFFTGTTTGTNNGVDFAGTWGGQFYSNPADSSASGDDLQPGAVAGTFGATSTDGSLLGAFGAYKMEETVSVTP